MAFALTSPACSSGSTIPSIYTADGLDISPPLEWSGAPPGTVTLALICDDPDAPGGTWTHWVLYGIPASATSLPEGIAGSVHLDDGSVQGLNSWGETGWRGPSPPSGTHRYVFRLHALDTALQPDSSTTARDLREAMHGHILSSASLTGLYSRSR